MIPLKCIARTLFVGASISLGACTQVVNPATGETEITAMSPAQEREVGSSQHPKILQEFGGAYEDAELQTYVESIGDRLKAVSELPEQDFTFTLLNSDVVNAFALPGGYVYVSRGLIALAENEAELAGVMAHEIGHVTARHSAQRYSRGVVAQGGVLLGSVLGGLLGGSQVAQAVQQLGGAGAQAWIAGYSREQEFQSDELGVRYLAKAGYDPKAMASFLTKLSLNSELASKLAGEEGAPDPSTSWFATHPRTPDRVRRAAEQAEAAVGTGTRLERDAYLRKIDGVIYGEDPDSGFVQDGRFVHPGLRFAFDIPPGFRIQNTPQAVLGGDRSGRLMKFDSGDLGAATNMRDYMAREWARELKLQNLGNITGFDVNDLPAATATTVARSQDGKTFEVGLAAIKVGAENVYRFMFLNPGKMSGDEARAYLDTVKSFVRLTPEDARAFEPKRIRVVEVQPGETEADLVERMEVDDFPTEHFRMLNGLAGDQQLQPGSLVKIITAS